MKILVVDDSIVYRTAISQALAEVPGVEVVSSASNGQVATDYLRKNPNGVDLITLDMEMPIMGGLDAIKEIRKFNKNVIIIVFSSVTLQGAEKTIEALGAGADDFVTKVQGTGTIEDSLEKIRELLLPKIKAFDSRKVSREVTHEAYEQKEISPSEVKSLEKIVEEMSIKPKLIVLGCSTGGPDALGNLFRGLDKLNVPMLIVQHMPPLFTEKLANMLNGISENIVVEVKGGEKIRPGHCYVAPGDYHMRLRKDLTLSIDQEEKRHFVRPAVDNLFESVAENCNDQVLSIVLTGMGDDGAEGAVALSKKGAYQFIQDEVTSVVWGMPGAVSRSGVNVTELPLKDFTSLLNLISKRI